VGFGILALLGYMAFLLRKRTTQFGASSGASELPELGPGLVPEMDGKGRIGELGTEKDIGESVNYTGLLNKTVAELS
jgi:hypothetical protein